MVCVFHAVLSTCLSKNSKICGSMFWKIAKARGDRCSIHLFTAEPIARILVVGSYLPFQ